MRVVFDTNIFFSFLIALGGHPYLAVRHWVDGKFDLVTCAPQIEEVRRVSRYTKFHRRFAPHEIGELINDLNSSIYIEPIPRKHTCDDPDDAYLLDLADASDADFLITGDHRAGLLKRRRVGRASIVTARAFVKILGQ